MLSAQATDKSVNLATQELYKVADTPEKILRLGEAGLIPYIKSIGLYKSKAKHVIGLCEKLISGCIASPRVANFKALNGRDPVAIVGKISNKSSEHIDTAMVAKRFQTAIINSGVMEFVADSEQRLELRAEKVDQAENAYETAKSIGNELAADFMLQGTVYSHVDSEGREQVRTYQVDAQLIDIESNKILWQGEKTISKYIKKSAAKL